MTVHELTVFLEMHHSGEQMINGFLGRIHDQGVGAHELNSNLIQTLRKRYVEIQGPCDPMMKHDGLRWV